MESSKSRNTTMLLLSLIVLAGLSILAVVILNQRNASSSTTPENTELKNYCENNDGTWVEEAKECEGISEALCKAESGIYNGCASACRNDPEQDVCTLQCVVVCNFDSNSEITFQVQSGDNVMELTLTPETAETAYEFMARLAEKNSEFTFDYSDSSFGKFITSINGIAANPDTQFWELNVNGTPSQVGVSDLILNPGDIIEWKLVEFDASY